MSSTAWDTAFNDPLRHDAPSTGVSALIDAVDAYRTLDREHWSYEEIAVELVNLRRAEDRIVLEFSRLAARLAAAVGYGGGFEESPCYWVQNACRLTRPAAAQRICVGEQMARLPQSVAAVETGDIGFAHLALLARTAEDICRAPGDAASGIAAPGGVAPGIAAPGDAAPDDAAPTAVPVDGAAPGDAPRVTAFDEAALLERAKVLNVGRFFAVCRHARHAADPAAYAEGEVHAAERRELRLKSIEDEWLGIEGFLDPIAGAVLRTALEPLARRRGKEDRRLRGRRLADALVELAMHGLDADVVPRSATQRAHLQVTATLETLLGLTGAPAAEMEFGPPISAAMVERLSCDCTVTRILLGSDSAVIDVGRSRRVVPPSTRRALNVRDRHCVWPGCDRPPSWTSAHHVVPWTAQGRTDLDNLVLLCYRHHWKVHEGRWRLVRADGGMLALPPTHEMPNMARPPGADSRGGTGRPTSAKAGDRRPARRATDVG